MESLKEIIMKRDGLTSTEADDLIEEAKEELSHLIESGDLNAAENVCETYFSLEPDYLMDLL